MTSRLATQATMAADAVGLLCGSVALLLLLNVIPGLTLAWEWQLAAVALLCAINLLVWRRNAPEPMSVGQAAKQLAIGTAILLAVAAADTLIGYLGGQRTLFDAFIRSGPFGGIADAFLFFCLVLVGLPTLARAAYQFHHPRRLFGPR